MAGSTSCSKRRSTTKERKRWRRLEIAGAHPPKRLDLVPNAGRRWERVGRGRGGGPRDASGWIGSSERGEGVERAESPTTGRTSKGGIRRKGGKGGKGGGVPSCAKRSLASGEAGAAAFLGRERKTPGMPLLPDAVGHPVSRATYSSSSGCHREQKQTGRNKTRPRPFLLELLLRVFPLSFFFHLTLDFLFFFYIAR